MRDDVDALARELQRAKTGKGERITANTRMRVAVRLLLKHYSVGDTQAPNGEDELLEAVEKQCTWK